MNELKQSLDQFQALPTSGSFRLINFDSAEILSGTVAGTFILIVRGIKPYLNMEVNLMPLVYVQPPEYWGIEVIGSLPEIGLPAEAPYTVCIPLEGIRGTKGIEVIGANQSQQLPWNENLEGHWILKSGVGLQLLPDTTITIEFKDGKLSGKGGCNRYNASYTVEPLDQTSGKIQIQGIASTKMFCGDEINAQESSYFQALKQVREYRLTDEGLILPYPSPSRYLLFTRQ